MKPVLQRRGTYFDTYIVYTDMDTRKKMGLIEYHHKTRPGYFVTWTRKNGRYITTTYDTQQAALHFVAQEYAKEGY